MDEENSTDDLSRGVTRAFKDFLPYLLLRISTKLNVDLMEDLRRRKINIARWRVLAVLNVKDGQSIGEISEAAMMEQSALSRTIMRMEEEGLVKRKLLKSDNRYVQVFLTKTGKALFDQLHPIVRQRHDRCIEGMSEAETTQLFDLLDRVLDNLESGKS